MIPASSSSWFACHRHCGSGQATNQAADPARRGTACGAPAPRRWPHGILCALGLLVAACAGQPTPLAGPTATLARRAPPPAGAEAGPTPPPLVLWRVPEFGSSPGAGALEEALAAYQRAHPAIQVRVVLKASSGPASIQRFLESTARVAPHALPDVAVLPLSALRSVATGVLQPVPDVPSERIADAFPFARSRSAGQLPGGGAEPEGAASTPLAVPFAVDVVHAVAVNAVPPASWDELDLEHPLALPAGEGDLAALAPVLSLYAGAGGDLSRLPEVDPAAAERTFRLLAEARAAGTVVGRTTTPRQAWNALLTEGLAAAAISGGAFLSQQANFPGIRWGRLPGPEGPAPPVGWGWAFVVTSRNPERAARAGQLIDWLTAPPQRAWILTAGYLPAWQTDWAATTAGLDPPPAAEYVEFLVELLTDAESADQPEVWGPNWAAAVGEVLGGGSAEAALARIGP